MRLLAATRRVECATSRADLWPALSDTERLNRAMGMGPLEVEPANDGAARFTIATRLSGLTLRYREQPFEWRAPDFLRIRRRFLGGPVRAYMLQVDLRDGDSGGSQVDMRLELSPRSLLAWPLARLNLWVFLGKLSRSVARIDANLRAGRQAFEPPAAAGARDQILARVAAELAAERELADRLVAHVQSGSDADLARIRPYELADAWGVERQRVLELCLDAVVAGLLDLRWDLVCPSCRTAASTAAALHELDTVAHCQLCDLSIGLELDRAVEAVFRPAAAVREVAAGPYCIGGPARTPHVLSQAILPAGGAVTLRAPEAPGRYRLFVRGGATASLEVSGDGEAAAAVAAGDALEPAQLLVVPGAELEVRDGAGDERHVKLELLDWSSQAATAHDVTAQARFRRLFSAEVLRPGLALEVSRAALLFTDLAGSTALYAEVGDAAAYAVVQAHFAALAGAIEEHGGALVKTIGDAVMAVFRRDEDAVRGALAMQRAYAELAAKDELAARMRLRVGGAVGACYMVTANGVLDYFGQSVNMAGRIEGLADGGDTVLPAELVRRAEEAGWLDGAEVVDSAVVELKGIRAPVEICRLRLREA